jgi:copper chaperone CopZ
MSIHTLNIKGMGSDHCIMVVKNIIGKQDGANIENIRIGQATISIDETKTTKEKIVAAIERMGYKVEQ